MEKLYPNRMGFIEHFLVSGVAEDDFVDNHIDDNQLHYEAFLRSIVPERNLDAPHGFPKIGEISRIGLPWRYHFTHGDSFVDYSTFYFTLKKIRLEAAVGLVSPVRQKITIRVWSYASIDLWCNGERKIVLKTPCYKPIMHKDAVLDLEEGLNSIYVSLQNLGVRDTRTLFGIQVRETESPVEISIPDAEESINGAAFLGGLRLSDHTISFPHAAPEGSEASYFDDTADFGRNGCRYSWTTISGKTSFTAEPGNPHIVIRVKSGDGYLSRKFEIPSEIYPRYGVVGDDEANREAYYRRMAEWKSLDHGSFGFSMPHILIRKYLGMEKPDDREMMYETLQQITDRYDCSDFLVGSLIRYIHNYEMDDELSADVKKTLLGYRYWMTMEGSDAMCMWSENHAMQFFASAYLAGRLYPEDYFSRAKMRGRELEAFGKARLNEWFDSVDEYGFEEFLSACYMCVTFAALVNLYDYAEEEIKRRAGRTLDRIMRMLSLHAFHGSVIAPMGRIYRDVIYPFTQGAQVLMNLVDSRTPISDKESYLVSYATSSYRFPDDLKELMESDADTSYSTGNALVKIKKTQDYLLTSVQSPRSDGFKRWPNLTLDASSLDTSKYPVVKSLNERFHGTTAFGPGKYGYQQHMWVAALSPEALVFANHPGGTYDGSSMRPGYWYGNGIMPAVMQTEDAIASIYSITDDYPVHFVHIYAPLSKFDKAEIEDHWLFLSKGNGNIAIWSSGRLEPYSDELPDSEFRIYKDKTAFICYVGSGNPEAFKKSCMKRLPAFDEESMTLSDASGIKLAYKAEEDRTQYV